MTKSAYKPAHSASFNEQICTMSIALEAKVTALEAEVSELKRQIEKLSILRSGDPLPLDKLDLMRRITVLEQTAQRKPGPKPREQA